MIHYAWSDMARLDGSGWIDYQITEGWRLRVPRPSGEPLVIAGWSAPVNAVG